MTKKIINTLIIIAVLIAISFIEDSVVTNSLAEVDNLCAEIQTMTDDSEFINDIEIMMRLENLSEFWRRQEVAICLLANHKDIRDIGLEIEKAKIYLALNEAQDFQASLAAIRYFTDSYLHTMGASFTNIL